MTEADEFFEKTAMFDDAYSNAAPIFAPFTKEEAISRLKQAEEQFRSGQWHTMEEVLAKVRRSICSYGS